MSSHPVRILCSTIFISATFLCACTRMYTLPDPPPESEWVNANPVQESPEEKMKRYLDAKRAAIQCFAALADSHWTQALSWMTDDTAEFLRKNAPNGDIIAAFDEKKLIIDGVEQPFDPVADVFISGLVDIRDEFGHIDDTEDENTKILYAVDKNGAARPITLIRENERWKVKLTHFKKPLLTP